MLSDSTEKPTMGCNNFSTYLLVHVLYARITDHEMLRPPPTENTRLLHTIYICIYIIYNDPLFQGYQGHIL